jgi:hypothetical protein
MRFFFTGPRILGIRPGISFGASDFRRLTRPRRDVAASQMTGSFVYVISNGIGGHKIGSSTDPIQRISSLQTGSAHELKFAYIGVTPGTGFNVEHAAHDLLDQHRIHNEWFNVPASIAVGAVIGVPQRLGEPIQQVSPQMVPQIIYQANQPDPAAPSGWRRIGRWTLGILLCILAALIWIAIFVPEPAHSEPGSRITDGMKPILAATRIFALENHLHGDLGIADPDEGHIGEEFEVNHDTGQECTFTMRRRNGPVVETISFDRLSREYRTYRRGEYTLLQVSGQPGAQCELSGGSRKCSSGLEMLLLDNGMAPHEFDLALRALRYISSNACRPVDLPF